MVSVILISLRHYYGFLLYFELDFSFLNYVVYIIVHYIILYSFL